MTTYEIELTIEGPYLTQSSAAGEYGVDAPMARTVKRDGTEEKRLAYVPASALKGKLKQAWQEIGLGDAEKLLGAKSGNQQEPGPWEPLPAQLHFGDLLLEEGRAASKLRHRIRIDRERGSVDEGALLVLESPFASGAHAIFRGSVRLMGSEEPGQVREWLERGLRWTPSLGAERTTGFGRILGVKVAAGKAVSREETSGGVTGSFQFALKPAGPFCVSMQRLSGNLFESNTEIPGGAIKGMVARMLLMEAGNGGYRVDAELGTMGTKLEKYRNLCAEFERVRFTHALPAKEGTKERPVRVPLSLVTAGEKLYDAADRDKPFLVGGEAPEFDIDWKKTPYGVKQFGWETIETELRVRTAIDPGKLRASDEQLFAYEMVNPDGFEWLGTADVSQVMDEKVRAAVTSELAALFRSGL